MTTIADITGPMCCSRCGANVTEDFMLGRCFDEQGEPQESDRHDVAETETIVWGPEGAHGHIASQSARIAELEAELSLAQQEASRRVADYEAMRAERERMGGERDAVRAAMAWFLSWLLPTTHTPDWMYVIGRAVDGVPRELSFDGTPEGLEAALLAAHAESTRKGGGQ